MTASTQDASRERSATGMVRTFRAMNTDWWIMAESVSGDDLARAERLVRDCEAAFSRFRPDSMLSRLNRERSVRDGELARLVARALELSEATRGAFDPRIGPALAAAGYDRSFEAIPPLVCGERIPTPVEALEVRISGDIVELSGLGALDLGGIAKGWTIDRVHHFLETVGATGHVIDGGGDIRVGGATPEGATWGIGVGERFAVRMTDGAVCTSSTSRRRWHTTRGEAHHVIDPRTGAPSQSEIQEATVIAADATTADALATATIANPAAALEGAMALGAEVLLNQGRRWEMTPGLARWLEA